MAENKRYYWIKLKTDFFNQDTIDFLLSQKNGCQYVVLYQMLCLKTANTNGNLITTIEEMIIPYDVNKIVRDTKYFDFDTVTVALELFKKLGLIYAEENDVLKISNYEDMVGSETDKAKLMRKKRAQEKIERSEVTLLPDCYQNVTQENRDKSIELRDKSIEIDNRENKETLKSVLDGYSSNPDLISTLQDYIEMRKTQKGFTVKALKLNLNELDKLAVNDEMKIDIVNQTIANGWKGFYPLKSQKNQQKQDERAF